MTMHNRSERSPLTPVILVGIVGTALIVGIIFLFKFEISKKAAMTSQGDKQIVAQLQNEVTRLEKQVADLKNVKPVEPPAEVTAVSEATSTEAVNSKKDFVWHDFSFSYPASWLLKTDENGGQYFSDHDKKVAKITCPVPPVGFEAWEMSVNQKRSYVHNKRTYEAWLWLLKPSQEAADAGWLTIIFGAMNSEFSEQNSCMIMLTTSNPPTAAERALAEEIYKSIK